MPRREQPLYRHTDDKMLGGVCSGLAHYFDVDTTLVRVIFVALMVLGGGTALAYLLLWAILDPAPTSVLEPPSEPAILPESPNSSGLGVEVGGADDVVASEEVVEDPSTTQEP